MNREEKEKIENPESKKVGAPAANGKSKPRHAVGNTKVKKSASAKKASVSESKKKSESTASIAPRQPSGTGKAADKKAETSTAKKTTVKKSSAPTAGKAADKKAETSAAKKTTVKKSSAPTAGKAADKKADSSAVKKTTTKKVGTSAAKKASEKSADVPAVKSRNLSSGESTSKSGTSAAKANTTAKQSAARKKKKKKSGAPLVSIPIVTAILVLTMGVVLSGTSLGLFNHVEAEVFVETEQSNSALAEPEGMFISGISIEGIDLGGWTMEEAQEALTVTESQLIPSITYTLTCECEEEKIIYITEDDFDWEFDTIQVLNKAYEYSEYMRRTLTSEGRTKLREDDEKDFSITVSLVDGTIDAVVANTADMVNVEAQDAHVTNIDTSKETVSSMFSFEEGIVGYTLDTEDLTTQLTTLLDKENYTADIIGEITVKEPEYTIADLKENLVLISSYKTYSSNTWAGNMNMSTAFESMTGSIIKVGETFSFNDKTGNSNLTENGYYSAGVIVNGTSANGVGGGICQAATTIYNAAIRADMTIIEREPHTWPSTYVPVGVDAAIDWGNIDLKFQNNTDHEIYLICYMENATLYAYFYGYKPDDFDEITVSSWFTGSTSSGFTAAACRYYYKDGEVVKEEDLFSSYYSSGGGTSYAYTEALSGYTFEKVFSDSSGDDDAEDSSS